MNNYAMNMHTNCDNNQTVKSTNTKFIRFVVFKEVTMKNDIFWDVTMWLL
jgi:hypothetical protein